jgi:hypothetical protein
MKKLIPVPPALPGLAVAHALRTAVNRMAICGFISGLRRSVGRRRCAGALATGVRPHERCREESGRKRKVGDER